MPTSSVLIFSGSAKAQCHVGSGGDLNGPLVVSCIRNICATYYWNLAVHLQVM